MQQLAFPMLLVLVVAYAAFALPVYFRFLSYCKKVARATGRESENQELKANEDGNNAFEREQYRKLWSGEYAELPDPTLVAQGRLLAVRVRLSWWLAVGLVTFTGATVFWPQ